MAIKLRKGAIDLKGRRVGRLVVLEPVKSGNGLIWACKCDCGKYCEKRSGGLNNGSTKSCGCLGEERKRSGFNRTHGKSRHQLYGSWSAMHYRCYNPNSPDYKNYGGRGISVCDRWHDVSCFIQDMENIYTPGHSLDRIDVNKDYSPENCRWADPSTQAKNKVKKRVRQSKYRGIQWDSRKKKWRGVLHLGSFSCEEEASQIYEKVRDYLMEIKV